MECNAGAINPRIHPVTTSGSRDKGADKACGSYYFLNRVFHCNQPELAVNVVSGAVNGSGMPLVGLPSGATLADLEAG